VRSASAEFKELSINHHHSSVEVWKRKAIDSGMNKNISFAVKGTELLFTASHEGHFLRQYAAALCPSAFQKRKIQVLKIK